MTALPPAHPAGVIWKHQISLTLILYRLICIMNILVSVNIYTGPLQLMLRCDVPPYPVQSIKHMQTETCKERSNSSIYLADSVKAIKMLSDLRLRASVKTPHTKTEAWVLPPFSLHQNPLSTRTARSRQQCTCRNVFTLPPTASPPWALDSCLLAWCLL